MWEGFFLHTPENLEFLAGTQHTYLRARRGVGLGDLLLSVHLSGLEVSVLHPLPLRGRSNNHGHGHGTGISPHVMNLSWVTILREEGGGL